MERTQPQVIGSAALKAHEVADNLLDFGAVDNFLYGFPVDYCSA